MTRRTDGFSLAEALVVITLLAVLGTSVLSAFLGNAGFYARNRHVITARQNLHGTIELLASEIRQASAADFIAAETDSLALRFDVSRAVVCDSTSSDRIALLVFDTVRAANVPSSFRGTAISEPYDSAFTFLDGWVGTPTAKGSGPKAFCAARGAALGVPASRFRELAGWGASYGRLPAPGAIVRTYGELSFRLSASTFDRGLAVRRNGQEVTAPFDSASSFSYVMRDGSELPAVSASRMEDLIAVRIRLMARLGGGPRGVGTPLKTSVDHLVFLRN